MRTSDSRRRRSTPPQLRAFSLLEIMVAIAILGLTLTVILSAQGSLSASDKIAAFEAAGIRVAPSPAQMAETLMAMMKKG